VPRRAPHGELNAHALVGSLALRLALAERHAPLGVDLLVGPAVASVRMRGDAGPGAAAYSGSALDVHMLASFLFRASVAEWLDLRLELGAGAPLQAVEATDEGVVMASTQGVELRAAFGAELRL
jgi:hypothetical protein